MIKALLILLIALMSLSTLKAEEPYNSRQRWEESSEDSDDDNGFSEVASDVTADADSGEEGEEEEAEEIDGEGDVIRAINLILSDDLAEAVKAMQSLIVFHNGSNDNARMVQDRLNHTLEHDARRELLRDRIANTPLAAQQ